MKRVKNQTIDELELCKSTLKYEMSMNDEMEKSYIELQKSNEKLLNALNYFMQLCVKNDLDFDIEKIIKKVKIEE